MNGQGEQTSNDTGLNDMGLEGMREPTAGGQRADTEDTARAGATSAGQGFGDRADPGPLVETGATSGVDEANRTDVDHRGGGMLAEGEVSSFRQRWHDIQGSFVDDPHTAVANADGLVLEVSGRLAERFSQQRERLEDEWVRGGERETEGLRVALQHYRSFFESLIER